jgi:flagellin-like protein
MRELGMKKEQRRRMRYARLRAQKKAVSPVVATLILILVAVAAAAALYLWLVAWQGGVTKGIGSPGAQYTVTIGGSTSVYPFDTYAVAQFEQNNSDVVVSNNQGGSGAGMAAVCAGQIDIGTASTLETVDGLETSDGCPTTQTLLPDIQTVAYDAVDVILASGNPEGILSMNQTVLLSIYLADSVGSTPTLAMPAFGTSLGLTVGGGATWTEIPTTAGCFQHGGLPACTDSTYATAISTVSRSDASGTTQAFEARLLGATSATATATSLSGLGFSGCGSNNLLSDCGIATTKTADGNPAVITTVGTTAGAIGYASDGLVRAVGSGVIFVPFAAPGQTCAALAAYPASQVIDCGVIPSLSATGTIAAGITSSTTVANYAGWRPFEYVTLGAPIGEVERFIQFVLDPANNQNFATEAAEVSIYSV